MHYTEKESTFFQKKFQNHIKNVNQSEVSIIGKNSFNDIKVSK